MENRRGCMGPPERVKGLKPQRHEGHKGKPCVLSASVAKIPQTRLEVQSERELHDSRIPGTGDPSKVARGHVCVGVSKVGSVESIKHLPAELEVDLFGER